MKWFSKKTLTVIVLVAGIGATPLALSHLDPTAFHLSYRQSLFAILGANFGPMSSMVKGEIPWDSDRFRGFADDLATATTLDFMRGFPDGSQGGQTRARPEIWNNKADFESKLNDLRTEAAKLAEVAAGDDQKAIMMQFQSAGGTCKACHDDYKSKDYLN
jgi:cytochrome c556